MCSLSWLWYGSVINNTNLVYPNIVGLSYAAIYIFIYFRWGPHSFADGDGDGRKRGMCRGAEVMTLLSQTEQGAAPADSTGATGAGSGNGIGIEMTAMDAVGSSTAGMTNRSRSASLQPEPLSAQDSTSITISAGGGIDGRPAGAVMDFSTAVGTRGAMQIAAYADADAAPAGSAGSGVVTALLSDAVEFLDLGMEYLANVGRSRANSLFIDPTNSKHSGVLQVAESLQENIAAALNATTLAHASCGNCRYHLVTEAKYCWNCGTSIEAAARLPAVAEG